MWFIAAIFPPESVTKREKDIEKSKKTHLTFSSKTRKVQAENASKAAISS